jgi:hypothetical protein
MRTITTDMRSEVRDEMTFRNRDVTNAADTLRVKLEGFMREAADAAANGIDYPPSTTLDVSITELTQTLMQFTEFRFEKRSRS